MKNNFKTIVFDLDGTIYQNNNFYKDYLYFLLDDSGKENWLEPLCLYVENAIMGKGLVMNTFYKCDVLSSASPIEFKEKLENNRVDNVDFSTAANFPNELIYTGDVWAVVGLIGKALGLTEDGRGDKVYRLTRKKMSDDGMIGNMQLRDSLMRLKESHETVLLSNSYKETAEDFLRQLGFDGVFSNAIYSANKPYNMVENLANVYPTIFSAPDEFLTVGDHAFNDLMPLQQLGCKALWINPFHNIHEPAYDITVHTLEQLACCLDNISGNKI